MYSKALEISAIIKCTASIPAYHVFMSHQTLGALLYSNRAKRFHRADHVLGLGNERLVSMEILCNHIESYMTLLFIMREMSKRHALSQNPDILLLITLIVRWTSPHFWPVKWASFIKLMWTNLIAGALRQTIFISTENLINDVFWGRSCPWKFM